MIGRLLARLFPSRPPHPKPWLGDPLPWVPAAEYEGVEASPLYDETYAHVVFDAAADLYHDLGFDDPAEFATYMELAVLMEDS